MTNSVYGIALSGLNAARSGLSTTSNNIANVNTVGYNRQQSIQNARPANSVGSEFIGQGVDVQSVERVYSEFVAAQQEKATSESAFFTAKYDQVSRIDGIIADEASGLASAMNDFFNSAQVLSNDPANMSARQNYLSSAESLAARFNGINTVMDDLRFATDLKVTDAVDRINNATTQIAELNSRITAYTSESNNRGLPNDLLDQRDKLVVELAEQVQITKVNLSDGSVNLFMGNGQPLVVKDDSFKVTTLRDPEDPENLLVGVNRKINGEERLISFDADSLGSGALAGYLSFREDELSEYQNTIGLIAAQIGSSINTLQQGGVDLAGAAGTEMFSFGASLNPIDDYSRVNPNAYNDDANPISLTLNSLDLSKVTGDDYEILIRDNGGVPTPQFRIAGEGGKFVDLAQVPAGSGNFVVPDVAGNPVLSFGLGALAGSNIGDRFTVMPTRDAARNISVAFSRPELVAAASAADAQPGNNENILAIAGLQSKGALFQNFNPKGVSVSDAFNQLVSRVGNKTRELEVSSEARQSVLAQIVETRDAQSGVNMDEEAANLLKYQQAYQAAGRVISLSKEMFDQILGIFR
ncbi:MAG: flagellar hook-associated protein FlgK [Limnobacter sp.]|nr:flagellar hook-associated protein FlgK [Limnobacter sp.]